MVFRQQARQYHNMFDFKKISALIERLTGAMPEIEKQLPAIIKRLEDLESRLIGLAELNIELLRKIEENTRHD